MNYKTESEMFDRAADYYDRFRPGYPQEIIESFLDKAKIKSGDRLLEIGAGSGKATEQFCGKGLDITCITVRLAKNPYSCFDGYSIILLSLNVIKP